MLSRVANSIYWMARYLERAENLARFIDVTLAMILDQPRGGAEPWEPLVRATGDDAYFSEHYRTFNSENVRQFLTFDGNYPNSIISALSLARENARTVREAIPSEAWEQINTYYHFVRDARPKGHLAATSDFYNSVKQHNHLLEGLLTSTMSRGEGYHFAQLGRMLERADKTSRILDVKYFTLLPKPADVGTTIDDLHWSAVLRSVSGYEMFRKSYRVITVGRVVEFLVLDRAFPRAISHCIEEAERSLARLGGPVPSVQNLARHRIASLVSRLDQTSAAMIVTGGLHEFLDDLQLEINDVGEAIHDTYFAFRPVPTAAPAEDAGPALGQTQGRSPSQSQSQSTG